MRRGCCFGLDFLPTCGEFAGMGIWSNLLRTPAKKVRVRPAVAPAEIGLASPGNEYPDTSAALLDALTEEGTRRLVEQHGRDTRKRSKGNRP